MRQRAGEQQLRLDPAAGLERALREQSPELRIAGGDRGYGGVAEQPVRDGFAGLDQPSSDAERRLRR